MEQFVFLLQCQQRSYNFHTLKSASIAQDPIQLCLKVLTQDFLIAYGLRIIFTSPFLLQCSTSDFPFLPQGLKIFTFVLWHYYLHNYYYSSTYILRKIIYIDEYRYICRSTLLL